MKKIIIIVVSVLVLAGSAFLLYHFFQLESLLEQHVQIKEGKEDLIVLVNISDGDRAYIASKINEVAKCNPLLIGIDVFFGNHSVTSKQDSLLLESIKNNNCTLGTRHEGIGTNGVHPIFLKAAKAYGYAELSKENRFVTNFDVFRDLKNQRDHHFAQVVANQIDSASTARFLQSLDGSTSDIVITRGTGQFKIFDFQEDITCEEIQNNVIIFGYLGPTNEDKHTTYARFLAEETIEGPDMYGAIIVANQILMMLE